MNLRWGILQEGDMELGTTHHRRYKELITEVKFAEEMGFSFWGGSEQHTLSPTCTVSAPSVLYANIAAHTTRIEFMHQIVLLTHNINHPLRVAESLTTLDNVSDGRAILGVGRGNNPYANRAFEVDPATTREEMLESLEVIGKALSQQKFSHKGKRLDIPEMTLTPRPYRDPHPPILMVGTSLESNRLAGEMGIGIINFDNWLGWHDLEQKANAYKEAIKNPTRPISSHVTNRMVNCAITAYCAETREEAIELAKPVALSFLSAVSQFTYGQLAKQSKDFEYMAETGEKLKEMIETKDIEGLMDLTPSLLIGTPNDFIERGERLLDMGYDDISIRLEGMGHKKVMESMDLMGRRVIPHFSNPNSIAKYASIDPDVRLT